MFVEKEDGIEILGKGKPVIYIGNRLVKDESELERFKEKSNLEKALIKSLEKQEKSSTLKRLYI